MSAMGAHVVGLGERRRLGAWSFWISLATLVVTVALAAVYAKPLVEVYVDAGEPSFGGRVRSFASAVLPFWLTFAAPVLFLASLLTGVAGLLRRGDRRALAGVGILVTLIGCAVIALLFGLAQPVAQG